MTGPENAAPLLQRHNQNQELIALATQRLTRLEAMLQKRNDKKADREANSLSANEKAQSSKQTEDLIRFGQIIEENRIIIPIIERNIQDIETLERSYTHLLRQAQFNEIQRLFQIGTISSDDFEREKAKYEKIMSRGSISVAPPEMEQPTDAETSEASSEELMSPEVPQREVRIFTGRERSETEQEFENEEIALSIESAIKKFIREHAGESISAITLNNILGLYGANLDASAVMKQIINKLDINEKIEMAQREEETIYKYSELDTNLQQEEE